MQTKERNNSGFLYVFTSHAFLIKEYYMKDKRIQTIKFIILVGIFYAFLAFNIFNIAEKLVPSTKDYVNSDIPQTNQNIEATYLETVESGTTQGQTGHFAASNATDRESVCNTVDMCNKIEFNGNFNDTEKYTYTKIITKIVQFIDNNSNENQQMQDVISTININKGNGNRRWYATHDTVILNLWSVQSTKEFINLSTHELGHITDLGYIQWSSPKMDKNYTEFGKAVFGIDDLSLWFYKLSRDKETIRKATAKKKNFCSGYWMSDPFEDFAECFNLYINHNSFFKQLGKTDTILKNKYNFIASIFNWGYISSNSQDLMLIKDNTSRRPRDSTKISN